MQACKPALCCPKRLDTSVHTGLTCNYRVQGQGLLRAEALYLRLGCNLCHSTARHTCRHRTGLAQQQRPLSCLLRRQGEYVSFQLCRSSEVVGTSTRKCAHKAHADEAASAGQEVADEPGYAAQLNALMPCPTVPMLYQTCLPF